MLYNLNSLGLASFGPVFCRLSHSQKNRHTTISWFIFFISQIHFVLIAYYLYWLICLQNSFVWLFTWKLHRDVRNVWLLVPFLGSMLSFCFSLFSSTNLFFLMCVFNFCLFYLGCTYWRYILRPKKNPYKHNPFHSLMTNELTNSVSLFTKHYIFTRFFSLNRRYTSVHRSRLHKTKQQWALDRNRENTLYIARMYWTLFLASVYYICFNIIVTRHMSTANFISKIRSILFRWYKNRFLCRLPRKRCHNICWLFFFSFNSIVNIHNFFLLLICAQFDSHTEKNIRLHTKKPFVDFFFLSTVTSLSFQYIIPIGCRQNMFCL